MNERIRRLASAMDARGLDHLLITDDLNLYYYLDIREQSMERLRVLAVDRSGGCTLYANALFAPPPCPVPTELHKDGQEAAALATLAKQLGTGRRAGIDPAWSAGYLLALQALCPGCALCDAGALLSLPMLCKDQEEQEWMRRSSRVNDTVVEQLIASISETCTERSLSQAIHSLYSAQGADGAAGGALVAFGANCASPHPLCRDVSPQPGDCILIDAGAPLEMYQSDMTRTVFFRQVSAEMERVYQTVLAANLAGIAAVRPGCTAAQVDAAARAVIEDAGYGPFFTHRTGHGIGLHLHEAPAIGPGSDILLQEGMIFSVEPGIYLPGQGGVRIEDLVLVTAHGAEVLNHLSKDLRVI